jgi:hypothetical protein
MRIETEQIDEFSSYGVKKKYTRNEWERCENYTRNEWKLDFQDSSAGRARKTDTTAYEEKLIAKSQADIRVRGGGADAQDFDDDDEDGGNL